MVLSRQAPELGTLLRAESKRLWSPVKNDTLETDEFVALLEAAPAPVVTAQWKATVAAYPGEYLATRALLLRWVVQSPEPGLCHPFHVGDEGDPADLKELGVKPRLNARDEKLADYGTFFLRHTPVYGHALFGLIGIGLMVLLLRRREPADVMLAALIVSAFVFTATFAVLSLACDWRYLYIVDLSVMTALVYAAADWRALLRQK
jgi:hypothetical protein